MFKTVGIGINHYKLKQTNITNLKGDSNPNHKYVLS